MTPVVQETADVIASYGPNFVYKYASPQRMQSIRGQARVLGTLPWRDALNLAATRNGFENWSHALRCRKLTRMTATSPAARKILYKTWARAQVPADAPMAAHLRRPKPAAPKSPLAQARAEAHSIFDQLWKSGEMTRTEAYRWLAEQLRIPYERCHMLQFDEYLCQQVVKVCVLRDFDAMEAS